MPQIDTSVPSVARIYDYLLGGKDNFAADREAAERQAAAVPQLPSMARQNREFLRRAVRFVAGQGVTQFLDLGSGLPTNENVHEVAQRVQPDARVVYVDIDSIAVSHARALLAGQRTEAIWGDLCRPDEILADPDVRKLIDFGQPVAVLAVSVLHSIADESDPAGAMARLRAVMAPGSYLVISHAAVSPGHVVGAKRLSKAARELADSIPRTATVPGRTRDEIAAFFGDLTLVEPGLTDIGAWRQEGEQDTVTSDVFRMLGGVARAGG
ncbi:MAG: SAM-dependent methyltransferase [Trebonia sp.]